MERIEALIEEALGEGLGPAVERRVRERMGFDVLIVEALEVPGSKHTVGLDERLERASRARWPTYGRELMPVKRAALAARGVAIDTEVLGREIERRAYYREFVRPQRGRSSMLGYPRLGGAVLGGIVVGRAGTFCDGDARALEGLLGPVSVAAAALSGVAAARRAAPAGAELTGREAEIMACVRLGYTNGQIGEALGLSAFTVRNRLVTIFEKLGAGSRAEAAALWRGHGTSVP